MTKNKLIEFFNRLEGKEGCNFRKVKGKYTWDCGGTDKKFAKKILTLMKVSAIEQKQLLVLCEEHGGYCDCEILLNAEQQLLK